MIISRSISRPISRSIIVGADADASFKDTDQDASLIIDFTSGVYGQQASEEALANDMSPRPALFLDFTGDLYFIGNS